jgi:hypothetical protein
MALWHYLKSLHELHGWCKIKVTTLKRKYNRAVSTINHWLGCLRAAGLLRSEQHGQTCCVYTILVGQIGRPEQQPSLFTESEKEFSSTKKKAEVVSEVQEERAVEEKKSAGLPEKIKGILERAAARIARAKNPAAYRQSIISCELRLLKAPPDPPAVKKPIQREEEFKDDRKADETALMRLFSWT